VPFVPAPGPAVVGPFPNVAELRDAYALPPDDVIASSSDRQAFCVHFALDHIRPDGTVHFGSALFSALCQRVEERGDTMRVRWVAAYRLAWCRLLSASTYTPD
jgi:hypothetical protein